MGYSSSMVVGLLFRQLVQSVLMTDLNKPNGELCKYQRPLNSRAEDVVINSLTLERDDIDEGVFNVNVCVPNLVFPDNPEDKSRPDTKRIDYLSELGNRALGEGEEVWDPLGNWCFKLQQDQLVEDTNNQHYINFRVEFFT